jgi:flagellin
LAAADTRARARGRRPDAGTIHGTVISADWATSDRSETVMPLTIATNVTSQLAQKNTSANQASLHRSLERLSSGYRVNTAADDAAGLAVSEGMKSQIRSYAVAERNANDAISMVQTAEGALGEVHGILARMRELAMQSANGSNTSAERGYLDLEYTALKDELTRIQGATEFNSVKLLAATPTSVTFQVGLDNDANDQLNVTFVGVPLTSLIATSVAGSDASAAQGSLSEIDNAIAAVSSGRAGFGAAMNRLEHTSASLQVMRLNLSAANSRIRDVDVAEESAQLSKSQVLQQAGISVIGQANKLPESALALLQGG